MALNALGRNPAVTATSRPNSSRRSASPTLTTSFASDSIGRANGGQLTESEMRKLYDAGYDAGVRTAEDKLRAAGFHDIDDESNEDLAQMAIVCALHSERLRNDREREFVRKMVQWTARGRRLSEKQEDWLRDCHERARQ